MRRSLWALARDYRVAYVTLYLDLGVDGLRVAILRDEKRGGKVGKGVIERMSASLQPPPPVDRRGRGSWEAQHSWTVCALEDPVCLAEKVTGFLVGDGWNTMVVPPPAPLPTLPPEASVEARDSGEVAVKSVHAALDLALRSEVGTIMAFFRGGSTASPRGVNGKSLARAKHSVLEDARILGASLESSIKSFCQTAVDAGEFELSDSKVWMECVRLWARVKLQQKLDNEE